MSKNLIESMRTISHQITNINKEADLKKKKNQLKILQLENTTI